MYVHVGVSGVSGHELHNKTMSVIDKKDDDRNTPSLHSFKANKWLSKVLLRIIPDNICN